MKTYWKTASHKSGFDKTRTLTYSLKVTHLNFHVSTTLLTTRPPSHLICDGAFYSTIYPNYGYRRLWRRHRAGNIKYPPYNV